MSNTMPSLEAAALEEPAKTRLSLVVGRLNSTPYSLDGLGTKETASMSKIHRLLI